MRIKLRNNVFSRFGYAFVALSLAVWLLTAGLGFRVEPLASWSVIVTAVGILLIVSGAFYDPGQMRKNPSGYVYCRQCGWCGPGGTWDEYEGCPKCDNREGCRTLIQ